MGRIKRQLKVLVKFRLCRNKNCYKKQFSPDFLSRSKLPRRRMHKCDSPLIYEFSSCGAKLL